MKTEYFYYTLILSYEESNFTGLFYYYSAITQENHLCGNSLESHLYLLFDVAKDSEQGVPKVIY